MAKTLVHASPRISSRDVDFSSIAGLWNVPNENARQLLPSDRHAIRQACNALARLGEQLTDLLSPAGAVGYRALPSASAPTMVRAIPNRLWLEIRFLERFENPIASPKIFVEFTPKQQTFGLFVCGISSAQKSTEFWTVVHDKAPSVFEALLRSLDDQSGEFDRKDSRSVSWRVTRHSPPTEQAQSNTNINDCLRQRSKAGSKFCDSFTIGTSFEEPHPSIRSISTTFADLAELLLPLFMVKIDDDISEVPLAS